MTGYQVVFDREKMVLGWKPSNCEFLFPYLTLEPSAYAKLVEV